MKNVFLTIITITMTLVISNIAGATGSYDWGELYCEYLDKKIGYLEGKFDEHCEPEVACPCDDLTSSNGETGNQIVEKICPGGGVPVESARITVLDRRVNFLELEDGNNYQTLDNLNPNQEERYACQVNNELIYITEAQYKSCRERLLNSCS